MSVATLLLLTAVLLFAGSGLANGDTVPPSRLCRRLEQKNDGDLASMVRGNSDRDARLRMAEHFRKCCMETASERPVCFRKLREQRVAALCAGNGSLTIWREQKAKHLELKSQCCTSEKADHNIMKCFENVMRSTKMEKRKENKERRKGNKERRLEKQKQKKEHSTKKRKIELKQRCCAMGSDAHEKIGDSPTRRTCSRQMRTQDLDAGADHKICSKSFIRCCMKNPSDAK